MAVVIEVEGAPVPKPRTRRARNGHLFIPPAASRHQAAIGWHARQHYGAYRSGPVRVSVVFFEARWRGDLDNLAKLVLDGLQDGGVIGNDRQVVELFCARRKSPDERTWIRVAGRDEPAGLTSDP